MKHYFILTATFLALSLSGQAQFILANRHLSNLRSPTAINEHLLPWKANKINLGSPRKTWKNIYLAGNIYKGSDRILYIDTTGNAFFGILAGRINTGTGNTAIGDSAMYNNTTGSENTANGYGALYSNTDGFGNAALSGGNLFSNTTGFFNVASGYGALFNNTVGFLNVASGSFALVRNTTGTGNVGIGNSALWTNETNSNNTAIGNEATGNSFDYSNATFLGASSNADSGLTNFTAIGFGALAKKSNQVVVGNTEVTSIGGYANWSNFSDGRYKKDIKTDVPGIEFIKQLRPVTYTLDVDGIESLNKTTGQTQSIHGISSLNSRIPLSVTALLKGQKQQSAQESNAKQEKEKVVYTGFIAQEVEQAAQKLNYNFSGVDAPKREKGVYALRYGDFVVPLVKAVQEQQKQIDEQQKQIEELKILIQSLTKQSASSAGNLSSTAFLKQNNPNPSSKGTVINYYIPDNLNHGQIIVTDMKGSVIKTFTATKGEGQVNLRTGELPAATYNYTLLVNGKRIDTRQMVIGK